MTPRGTILVLLGVTDRAEAESRLQISIGYLTAMLSQVDPSKAPKLEDILGDTEKSEAEIAEARPEELKQNALSWIATMRGMSGDKRPVQPKGKEESDGERPDC